VLVPVAAVEHAFGRNFFIWMRVDAERRGGAVDQTMDKVDVAPGMDAVTPA
jgi:hypothetical protein